MRFDELFRPGFLLFPNKFPLKFVDKVNPLNMTKASIEVVTVLRKTAQRIENSNAYQWGHMGLCNCGFLAQEITTLRKEEIHSRAMQRHGDWTEQLNDYCPTSGLPMDEVISQMLAFGFDRDDLCHLERLSSPFVLRSLPPDQRNLSHNLKKDVIAYINTWADALERILLEAIELPGITQVHKPAKAIVS